MKKRYYPTWESIRSHQVPQWYEDCKLGIFIHWGLYSVPAFATPTAELGVVTDEEWFCNNPYAEWYYNSLKMGLQMTGLTVFLKTTVPKNTNMVRSPAKRSGKCAGALDYHLVIMLLKAKNIHSQLVNL